MKKTNCLLLLLGFILSIQTYSQVSSSFIVKGDLDKFYPVTFFDGGWGNSVPTNLKLGRSNTHLDSSWRGSLMASFNYHVTNYGHSSNFIDADVKPSFAGTNKSFIAGWRDATVSGTCTCIIIWLRGGSTTYYYQSNYAVNPVVYDGVQNPLPYNEVNGPAHSFKTTADSYVSTGGIYQSRDNYFMGNVGIGTTKPDAKLTVNGTIHSTEVKVTQTVPADYVFQKYYLGESSLKPNYKLLTLSEVEKFTKENHHLPNVPSAKEIQENGLQLGEMSNILLQKIEELTLYSIEQQKTIDKLKKENESFKKLEERLVRLEKELATKK